jgi:hypothetical protein
MNGSTDSEPDLVCKLTDNETPSIAVVTAVANIANQPAEEMDPLTKTIDADALDKLFKNANKTESPVKLTFTYFGYRVMITSHKILIYSQNNSHEK